jgi:hypothetical protein
MVMVDMVDDGGGRTLEGARERAIPLKKINS